MSRDPEREDDLGARLETLRPRLTRMVELRMHPRLRRRIDPADVIQEAFLDIQRDLPRYRDDPQLPFYLWARRAVGDKMYELHRRHLGAQMRDACRERGATVPEVSTISLSQCLLDPEPTPSEAGSRKESVELLRQALDRIDEDEREALTLRHFEEATNEEVARILGVSPATASRLYTKALRSVRGFLDRPETRRDP